MAFSFKFPKIGGGGDATLSSPMTVAADIPSSSRSLTSKLPLPGFLAGQPVVQQMKTLGGIFLAVMLLIAGPGFPRQPRVHAQHRLYRGLRRNAHAFPAPGESFVAGAAG